MAEAEAITEWAVSKEYTQKKIGCEKAHLAMKSEKPLRADMREDPGETGSQHPA